LELDKYAREKGVSTSYVLRQFVEIAVGQTVELPSNFERWQKLLKWIESLQDWQKEEMNVLDKILAKVTKLDTQLKFLQRDIMKVIIYTDETAKATGKHEQIIGNTKKRSDLLKTDQEIIED